MPTNLNALIRYRQIDKELRNPYTKTTIRRLQEVCSKQLEEFRGIYKLVSERTIRDDIRVMRSDTLGFNAPIVVKDGVYTYEDPNFSIYDGYLEDLDLLKDITQLLLEEKDNIKNPNLEKILYRLIEITGTKTQEPEIIPTNNKEIPVKSRLLEEESCDFMEDFSLDMDTIKSSEPISKKALSLNRESRFSWPTQKKEVVIIPDGKVLWNLILEVI